MVLKLRLSLHCLTLLLAGASCQKDNDINCQKEVSKCIVKKIRLAKQGMSREVPSSVWEWSVDGKIYYYFQSVCCDAFNTLYDNQCNIICAPSGGITGKGSGNCPDMSGEIVKTLVWDNPDYE